MRLWVSRKFAKISELREWVNFSLSKYSRKMAVRANQQRITLNRHVISGPPKIAIDTTVYQIFGKTVVSTEVKWRSWRTRDTMFRRIQGNRDSEELSKSLEMRSAFAVCEAFRSGDLRAILLESIARELAGAGDRHLSRFHGPERLDFDVEYETFDFFDLAQQSKEIFRRANISPEKIGDTSIPIDTKYIKLIQHLNGKAHQKDLIHLIACDVGNIDVFLTLDGKLTRAFASYQERKNVYKLNVKLLTPTELCKRMKMMPIEIPN